jgi:hypothetical protein
MLDSFLWVCFQEKYASAAQANDKLEEEVLFLKVLNLNQTSQLTLLFYSRSLLHLSICLDSESVFAGEV